MEKFLGNVKFRFINSFLKPSVLNDSSIFINIKCKH